jgi:hypothetical protein
MPRKLPIAQPRDITTADGFVGVEPEAENRPPEPTKRITIEVGETLHHRIKLDCVNRRVNLTDAVREVVEQAWPAKAA